MLYPQQVIQITSMNSRNKEYKRDYLVEHVKYVVLGKLLGEVAHELANSVTTLLGYSQLLQYSEQVPETKLNLDRLNCEAKRTAEIVHRILAFSRPDEFESGPVDLNALLVRTLDLKSYALEVSNIQVETQLEADLPEVVASSGQIESALLNLINNAHQAMSESNGQGTLRIRTERNGDNLLVGICDNGPGIRADILDSIFNPYFTTRVDRGGTGLGLSISRDCIESHGGRIWAESSSGRGASFFVELPFRRPSSRIDY